MVTKSNVLKMSAINLEFPFAITDVESDANAELLSCFHGERTGFVQVGPEKYFFPHKYKQEAAAYYNFQARSDDIWVISFPRSGTTWTQEMVWLVANNLDFVTAKQRALTERFPFFEFAVFMHPQVKAELLAQHANDAQKVEFIKQASRPGYETLNEIAPNCRRFIKTHFPFSLLPPSVMEQQCKIIYVARNPKDVAVSYYHLNRLFRTQGYTGDFETYWKYFEKGYNPWMPYYSHIKEAQAHRQHSNVLFLNYEDMLQNLNVAIQNIADFLNYQLDAEGLKELKQHLSKENFRKNPALNMRDMEIAGILNKGEAGFVRGDTGLQREYAENPELNKRVNKWILEHQIYK